MKIIFEDNDILVCVKPQGIISQSSENKSDAVSILKELTGSEIYTVHRLDKETGGLMVYAKNQKAAAKLSADIADRKVIKEYLALIHNSITPKADTLEDLLFFDRNRNKAYTVKRVRKGVKEAVLSYETVKSYEDEKGDFTLVKVKLETGRTHQIRVQFSSRGYPLVGDRRYGSDIKDKNLKLWSYRLTFNHPKTNEKMQFDVLPEWY